MTLTKWLVYVVILALMPIWARFLITYLLDFNFQARWFSESDIITFGLALVITNISGLENNTSIKRNWKTWNIGFSLCFAFAFAIIFAITCIQEIQPKLFSSDKILRISIIASFASLIYSYAIWNRIQVTRSTGEDL